MNKKLNFDINSYQLSCESTVDIPFNEINSKDIKILFYKYTINNTTYEDNMGKDKEKINEFYNELEKGNIPTTSQINEYEYLDFFKKILDSNKNVLHICLGTGMTKSYQNAVIAKAELLKEYKDKDIIIINSLCSSCGYGMLVLEAYELMKKENNIKTVVNSLEDIKNKIHHQFFSSDMKYYKRTGRVGGCCAFISSALKICPIMKLNNEGKIIAYNKAFGKGMAIKRTIDAMEKDCDDGINYNKKCIIAHSNCLSDALELKLRAEERFPNLKENIVIYDIGTIIASHCGGGTVAIFFFGNERK